MRLHTRERWVGSHPPPFTYMLAPSHSHTHTHTHILYVTRGACEREGKQRDACVHVRDRGGLEHTHTHTRTRAHTHPHTHTHAVCEADGACVRDEDG